MIGLSSPTSYISWHHCGFVSPRLHCKVHPKLWHEPFALRVGVTLQLILLDIRLSLVPSTLQLNSISRAVCFALPLKSSLQLQIRKTRPA